MKRRLFSAVLALAMLLTLTLPAAAADTLIVSDWYKKGFDAREIPIFDQTTGTTYKLGDTSADVTVLVAGRCRCGITGDAVKTFQKLFLDLNISNGQIFLLDMDGTADEVAWTTNFYREHSDEYPDIHIAWDEDGTYEFFFWTFYSAAMPEYNGSSHTLPAVCVLNGELEPIAYKAREGFEFTEENLLPILAPFAREEEPVQETLPAEAVTAAPTSAGVVIDDVHWSFDAYNIGGANFFKLRDLAYAFSGSPKQFEVSWNGAANCISLTSGRPYTAVGGEMAAPGSAVQTANPTTSKILLDGAEISLTAYNINGANYFKLRDLGQVFDFGVDWDGSTQTIYISTDKGYTP